MAIKSTHFVFIIIQIFFAKTFATSYAPPSFQIEGKFKIRKISISAHKSIKLPGCELELKKIDGESGELYRARADGALCKMGIGKVVELGIGDPICKIFYHESMAPTLSTDAACASGVKWYVHHFIKTEKTNERVVFQYWNSYEKSIAEIDFRDPYGIVDRVKARALKAVDVNECHSMNLSFDQINACRQPIEAIVSERAIKEQSVEVCELLLGKTVDGNEKCTLGVVKPQKNPDLCVKYLGYSKLHPNSFRLQDCLKDIAPSSFCDGLVHWSDKVACYEANGYCENIGDQRSVFYCMTGANMDNRIRQRGEQGVLNFCDANRNVLQEKCWADFINLKTKDDVSINQLKKVKALVDKSKLVGAAKATTLQLLVVKNKEDLQFTLDTCGEIKDVNFRDQCLRIGRERIKSQPQCSVLDRLFVRCK